MLQKGFTFLMFAALLMLFIGVNGIRQRGETPRHPEIVQTIVDNRYSAPNELRQEVDKHLPEEESKGTRKQVQSCLKAQKYFATAAVLTGVPGDLLAGIATIESGGCKFTKNGEAQGIMQAYKPDPRHLGIAENLIAQHSGETFDWQYNQLHNTVLGAVILRDYVERFGNLSDGLEA
jgi:hypothetical protein